MTGSDLAFPLPALAGRGKGACGTVVAISLLLSTTSICFAAGTIAAGRQKALACQTCHGLDGLSKLPEAPNLAGQPVPFLINALNDFRKGVRKNDMMSLAVQQLSDQDVADLAAFYAAIEVSVKPPK